MNLNKAREYFSAYHENTLEPGLRQAMDRVLATDAEIKAEYVTFTRAIEAINAMQTESIETPFDLHERISARIDREVWEKKNKQKVNWMSTWWRSLALGGVAVLAIVGTVTTVLRPTQTDSAQASIGGVGGGSASILKMDNGVLRVTVPQANGKSLKAMDAESGQEVLNLDLSKNKVNSPLDNNQEVARWVTLSVTGGDKVNVVVPGTKTRTETEGSGTMLDLAKHLADFYRAPVEVVGMENETKFTWTLQGTSLSDATTIKTSDSHVMVMKQSDMLRLSKSGK